VSPKTAVRFSKATFWDSFNAGKFALAEVSEDLDGAVAWKILEIHGKSRETVC
jgi:hypothetical protein